MNSQPSLSGSLAFDYVLLPDGLARNRRIWFDRHGRINRIERALDERRDGVFALGGMPNAHSHAFQRALVGRTEMPAGKDSFWSWRESMYRVAQRITPDHLHAIAVQAYGEMLLGGFTSVAEFHYLHHAPDGTPGPEMAQALVAAADEVGIRLALLPVFYQHGGFESPPGDRQARFVHQSIDEFCALLDRLDGQAAGIAPHSLRAVRATDLATLLERCAPLLPRRFPVHIHIAEQRAEVDACREHTGKTPVDLLFDEVDVDARFSLVHATHASATERARIIERGATVVLCPLTEGYLGDGVFPAAEFVAQGGNIAVGSDSNTRIDAVEELRLLEYVQRLGEERRLCLGDAETFGHALWLRAARGGGDSIGMGAGNAAGRLGAVEAGALCDLVTLELDRGPLGGVAPEHILDALLTAGSAAQVRDVYVGGRKVVDRGTLVADDGHARFVRTLRELAGD